MSVNSFITQSWEMGDEPCRRRRPYHPEIWFPLTRRAFLYMDTIRAIRQHFNSPVLP